MGSSNAASRLIKFWASLMVCFLLQSLQADAQCQPFSIELRSNDQTARFRVELAITKESRAVGLMNRATLAKGAGMVFKYESPQNARFWMRNTLIPLDLIFADERGLVTHVHENAQPLDETIIEGGTGVKFVLEINAGLAKLLQIAPGS
ncbi:MAG: uncharacterized membrane protein (UPF0127 family), partial [Paracoccaceae bacterium]